jgi:phosphoribosylanthranilate isomerase
VLEPVATRLIAQLHGDEEPGLVRSLKRFGFEVWTAIGGEGEAARARALAMLDAGADAVLMDARVQSASGVVYGGTGHRGDWNVAAQLVHEGARLVLAGGLKPEDVGEAIEVVRPWAVDCASGVEARKGIKDEAKLRSFVQAAKNAS